MNRTKYGFLIPFLLFLPTFLYSQEPSKPRPSPAAIVSLKYKDTYIKITYSQPHKRGREVFGKLVPYGKVWRTGANEATEMTITRDVFINGTLLPVGTYSLFSIPQPDKWTIIVNKDIGLWGSYNYNPKMDVVRFEVTTQTTGSNVYEAFTMLFDQRNNVADLLLMWDKTKVTIPFQFIEPKI